jgi:hypothetical protein
MNTETTPAAVAIRYWYDRSSRNWIGYGVDADGNQIGDAGYCYSRHGLDSMIAGLRHEHGLIPALRYGKDE